MLRTLLAVTLTFLVSACAGTSGPAPEENYYRLAISASDANKAKKGKLAGVVAVRRMESSQLHKERAILYSSDETGLKLNRFHYHLWIDAPNKMLQDYFVSSLRAAGIAKDVVAYNSFSRPRYELTGTIKHFEYLKSQQAVAVSIEFELRDHKRRKTLHRNTYTETQAVTADNATAIANAMSKALAVINQQLIHAL